MAGDRARDGAHDQGSLFPDPRGEQGNFPLAGRTEATPAEETGSPLDIPQRFADATSYQVRDELEDLVRRDLLGPWDGETEQFRPGAMGPRERYLVGMLGPRPRPKSEGTGADPAQDVELSTAQGDAGAELPEVLTPQSLGKLWASSMGLSFAVPADTGRLAVTATWGAYRKQETEDDNGKVRSVWAREPVSRALEVPLDATSARIQLLGRDHGGPGQGGDPDVPGVLLAVEVRPRGDRRVVQLVLINTQLEPASNADSAWLFQPQLAVTALDGAQPVFLPIDDPLDALGECDELGEAGAAGATGASGGNLEEAHLRLLYRAQRRYAAGRNVAVHASADPDQRCAHRLETSWLPVSNVPATVAPSGPESPLAGALLSMDQLAAVDLGELRAGLLPLADGYTAWLAEQEASLAALPGQLRAVGESAVFVARRAAERIRAGIDLLTDPAHPGQADALAAFRFANDAMAAQRRHTDLVRLREEQELSYSEAKVKVDARGEAAASWRPFQLAFVLLNLPALTDPAHPERAAAHTATVDLLFFPTGGGKTEAYLGLTAYTFAIRRLQGTVGAGVEARSGAAGVAVLMRYTLRLLTAQQFQRAAALVCAAEQLRRGDEARWGDEPFRIGLWVGGGVSPNWFEDAAEQVADAREAADGKRTNVLQTLSCPWCGTKVRGHHDLRPDPDLRRVLLHCPNGEGTAACPFSRRRSAEGLPILTIDEEIYRYAPSLVIATVDKLAQLPWRGYAGALFGRVRQRCPRHGYRHEDLDVRTGCTSKHNPKRNLPAVQSQPVTRLRPPDLIIQDELHLISGALGTTVGLFEAAVDELCTWPLPGGGEAGPKIVASTATTKRAREQVRGVFGRELAVFPPPVVDITDTCFSRQVPLSEEHPGRRYLGVCAHGVRLKSAEIRLAEILLLAGQTLLDRYGEPADPYLTLVGYFNATRELAGMRRYLDDDVATRIRSHGRRKGLSDRLVTGTQMLTIQELTSRISSGDISEVLKRLELGFDPELDTSARRQAIAADVRAAMRAKTASNPRIVVHPLADRHRDRIQQDRVPVDVVLATSMLQVGVDVSRFGLMVVTGQPKNTAEYIQASSRVGRDARRPGLVVALYNWTRPRDLAHFEDFEYYHATFYRQVEALSVTPYTRRALDRGVAATAVAAIRHAEGRFSRNTDAQDVPLDGPEVDRIVARLLARAEAIGGPRGRDYLGERLARLKDLWNQLKTGSTRLGYQAGTSSRQQLAGLLRQAGSGRWNELTVGQSMRETENEINLLVPAGEELFGPMYGAPQWTFFGTGDAPVAEEDLPAGDELGESTLSGRAG